jgi:hypothetical protein
MDGDQTCFVCNGDHLTAQLVDQLQRQVVRGQLRDFHIVSVDRRHSRAFDALESELLHEMLHGGGDDDGVLGMPTSIVRSLVELCRVSSVDAVRMAQESGVVGSLLVQFMREVLMDKSLRQFPPQTGGLSARCLDTIGRQCAHCGTQASPEKKLLFCQRCQCEAYCSEHCRLAHWQSSHAGACALMRVLCVLLRYMYEQEVAAALLEDCGSPMAGVMYAALHAPPTRVVANAFATMILYRDSSRLSLTQRQLIDIFVQAYGVADVAALFAECVDVHFRHTRVCQRLMPGRGDQQQHAMAA